MGLAIDIPFRRQWSADTYLYRSRRGCAMCVAQWQWRNARKTRQRESKVRGNARPHGLQVSLGDMGSGQMFVILGHALKQARRCNPVLTPRCLRHTTSTVTRDSIETWCLLFTEPHTASRKPSLANPGAPNTYCRYPDVFSTTRNHTSGRLDCASRRPKRRGPPKPTFIARSTRKPVAHEADVDEHVPLTLRAIAAHP